MSKCGPSRSVLSVCDKLAKEKSLSARALEESIPRGIVWCLQKFQFLIGGKNQGWSFQEGENSREPKAQHWQDGIKGSDIQVEKWCFAVVSGSGLHGLWLATSLLQAFTPQLQRPLLRVRPKMQKWNFFLRPNCQYHAFRNESLLKKCTTWKNCRPSV